MTKVSDLLDVHVDRLDSSSWHSEAFERAYCNGGPFDQVLTRVRNRHSVLVYLPGNCMGLAAQNAMSLDFGWEEFGIYTGATLSEIWAGTRSIAKSISEWFLGRTRPPAAIWHNLDILYGNRQNNLLNHPEARTALLALAQTIRTGVVLGFSDIRSGKLPDEVESLFHETASLDSISEESFRRLIPRGLGSMLCPDPVRADSEIPDAALWLIGSRMRWCDPMHAFRILHKVMPARPGDIKGVLKQILQNTISVEFQVAARPERPPGTSDEEAAAARAPKGMSEYYTMKDIKDLVVDPFRRFQDAAPNSPEGWRAQIKALPNGLILHGPPGTGKTKLARWIATETGLPYRIVSSVHVKEKWYGDPERNVYKLFNDARRAAPCILIFDDAEDLMPDRSTIRGTSVADATRGVVNCFMQQLEGFEGRPAGVLTILTTNRLYDLDAAIRDKLHLSVAVPYPVDKKQLTELIDAIAGELDMDLPAGNARNELEEFFWGPVVYLGEPPLNGAGQRVQAESNLFGPRAIWHALVRLRTYMGGQVLNMGHVKQLKDSYQREGNVKKTIAAPN